MTYVFCAHVQSTIYTMIVTLSVYKKEDTFNITTVVSKL